MKKANVVKVAVSIFMALLVIQFSVIFVVHEVKQGEVVVEENMVPLSGILDQTLADLEAEVGTLNEDESEDEDNSQVEEEVVLENEEMH